ncbi:MAG: magnesium-translocating P-type ATPase, partial [Betaproteobacteria bacterium]|nr:magnesium-translocating P-type ATPase [Betaproteobacteria bacterium]
MELKLTLFGVEILGRKIPAPGGRIGPGVATGAELLEVGRLTPEAALARLESSADGLLDRDADARLQRYGRNEVAHERHKSPARRLAELFLTPLSVLLLGLAIVNYLTGESKGAIVIALMVMLAVLLSFVQEFRSGKAAERLRAMVSTTATVLRKDARPDIPEGVDRQFPIAVHPKPAARREIPLSNVVPGDIVYLSAGDIVPADVRILSARDLFINQASLTGESLPVEKHAIEAPAGLRSALDLANIGFMGTNVVSGTASAVVVVTGPRTYFGGIAS